MEAAAILRQAAPLIGAGAAAFIAYRLGVGLSSARGAASGRVAALVGVVSEEQKAAFGSEEHRLRLAFRKLGLNVAGREKTALTLARLLAGFGVFLAIRALLGLPLLVSLVGFAGGWIVVNGMVNGAWAEVKQQIEAEIPQFLTGLSSTVQVTPNVLQAVEDELRTLRAGGALQTWLRDEFLPRCQREGFDALDGLTREAFGLSSSLGVIVFLIGRLWKTGGKEWESAFEMATRNLEGVLDARILGQATGKSAKNSVKLIAGITALVMVMILRNGALQGAVQMPLVQIAYVVIVLMMLFGWNFMNKLIDEAF
ncbi:hypothetical protein ATHL_01001 [Anaerolinea thermolimosa]|uniref:hypothetical protein n=1 Tax=Anaerolinea thermolimosa TaxID=229919 RepID=UPI0007823287|nr:hypothetical protein [Anaerolinea thermolimosa]GAP06155.1 hypothetical protein ATHL_01001 [Anaerolinea thermolimosa]